MSYSRIRIAAWLFLVCCACDSVEPRTQVMLIVDADPEVRRRATDLRVKIEGATAGESEPGSESYRAAFKPMGQEDTSWPYRFALVPKGGDPTRRYTAEAKLFERANELAVLRTTSGFLKGQTLALTLRFDPSCLGEESLSCSETETCERGECAPAGLDPGALPRLAQGVDGGLVELPEGGSGSITSGVGKAGSGGTAAAGSGGRAAAGRGGSTAGTGGTAGRPPVIVPGTGNCGDGMVSEDEACDTSIAADEPGACPTSCTPAEACESVVLEGSGCQARCAATPITERTPDDGCCPSGADANGDSDCGASCGNGVIESGESCDPIANCPSPATCTPMDMCLSAVVAGDPNTCNATCRMDPIVACQAGDGCCPSTCTRSTDSDCSPSCGDGVVDPNAGETCEAQSTERPCPASCDDGNACTLDLTTGSANNCNLNCVRLPILTPLSGDGCCPFGANANNDGDCAPACGNGVTERGERCDGNCPSEGSCADADSCTLDALSGSECTRQCSRTRITMVSAQGDGCCPPGGNANTDPDCPASCGNGVREPGEICDGNCPTDASCIDSDPCTDDRIVGAGCARTCPHARLGPNATTRDMCCPPGATSATDLDCEPTPPTMECGNGRVEGTETCDGNCPACETSMTCMRAVAGGTPCNPTCTIEPILRPANSDGCCPNGANANNDSDCAPMCGNGVTEPPETCDATCPSELGCNDSDPCTRDGVTGGACNTTCTNTDLGRAATPDSCCHPGDAEYQDPDCPARCGNGQRETGEECDDASATCLNCKTVVPEPEPEPAP